MLQFVLCGYETRAKSSGNSLQVFENKARGKILQLLKGDVVTADVTCPTHAQQCRVLNVTHNVTVMAQVTGHKP
jgi:hypothetical protein